jgi:putative exporter of polyketide antibiotics
VVSFVLPSLGPVAITAGGLLFAAALTGTVVLEMQISDLIQQMSQTSGHITTLQSTRCPA